MKTLKNEIKSFTERVASSKVVMSQQAQRVALHSRKKLFVNILFLLFREKPGLTYSFASLNFKTLCL